MYILLRNDTRNLLMMITEKLSAADHGVSYIPGRLRPLKLESEFSRYELSTAREIFQGLEHRCQSF